MSLLRLQSVAKRFDSKLILRDAFFPLSAGDRVGLIGKNSVGKTTVHVRINIGENDARAFSALTGGEFA